MGASSVGRVVSAALDPVLVPAGFARGQYGEGGNDRLGVAQIIFCAGHDELSGRYPRLPQANEQERGVGACIDLVIEVSDAGTIAFLDLEGTSLENTLRTVGLEADADAVARIEGHAFTETLLILEAALRRLFGTGD